MEKVGVRVDDSESEGERIWDGSRGKRVRMERKRGREEGGGSKRRPENESPKRASVSASASRLHQEKAEA